MHKNYISALYQLQNNILHLFLFYRLHIM